MTSELHHGFLQACSNHGTLSISEALNILDPMCQRYKVGKISEDNMKNLISEINENISLFDQEIKYIYHDLLDETFIVFTNTAQVEIHKLQTAYSESERNYFRIILRGIVLSNDRYLEPIAALNLARTVTPNSIEMNRAESLLSEWIEQGYFLKHNDFLYYGPKILAEFPNYLKQKYPDVINDCKLCKTPIFWRIICKKCNSEYHRSCIKTYVVDMKKCPVCKKSWDDPFEEI